MSSVLGNIFGGALGLVAGGLNYSGVSQQNRANARAAQRQMDFQERMSNTSYQRSVKDLESAGLNPMLAYGQGGASSPSGSSYMSQNPLSSTVSSAVDYARSMAEIRNMREVNRNLQETTRKIKSETLLNQYSAKAMSYELPAVYRDAMYQSYFDKNVPELRFFDRFSKSLQGVFGTARDFFRIKK